ncbi:hypothetical protein F5Y18DRAFT_188640 [Xylariaceae sp. FL1019]|nr:hypothetical protein F5Y18DRAFT_188640 [Xylariaceae sp. FL1019]
MAHSNGHLNGSANGSKKAVNGVNGMNGVNSMKQNGLNGLNGSNGHAVTHVSGKRTSSTKRRGAVSRLFNIAARLLTWYSIFTILFRCPATVELCDDEAPKICKPYFQVKQTVSPHLSPYYDAYAAPYVDLARPYYNTVDRAVIAPSRSFAIKYGGPRVAQAHAYSTVQWEKNVQPQILKYQALAKSQYDQSVSPYVRKAATVVAPYFDIARTNALQTYHELLLPSYTFIQPYAAQGYDVASTFTKDTAIPTTVWAWNKTYSFLDAAVWPHLREVYAAKVEPQLVRIGERLGRYKTKVNQTAQNTETSVPRSTFVKPTMSVASSAASIVSEITELATSTAVIEDAKSPESTEDVKSDSEAPKSRDEIRDLAAKTVAEDLELWEGKFSKVAEEGASEIEDRVDDISTRMVQNHANGMGKALLSQLGTTVSSEIDFLKKTILRILENDRPNKDEDVATAIRSAGLKIKNKAQDIRDWRQRYEQETEIAVTKAAEEHFTILDQTRDLALQKIGMKWAWMDGVTYKDWQKYHQLRARFDEWTNDLKNLITTHPGLITAESAGVEIEDEAMAIAHEAAAELGRLKQVAAWKATAGDLTDDFDSNTMQLAAEAAEKRLAGAAKAATQKLSDDAEAARLAASEVVDTVASGAQSVSEAVGDAMSSVVSPHVSGPSSTATTTLTNSEQSETVTVSLSHNDDAPEDSATSAMPPMESLASEPTENATALAVESTNPAELVEPLPTSNLVDGPDQLEETLLEETDLPLHAVDPEATHAPVKSAILGAAAESVPTRSPILDDEVVSSASSAFSVVQSDVPASITSAAQAAYTAAMVGAADNYAKAISAVSAQIHGEPKPAHEEMLSSVSSGYFSAMAAANSQLSVVMDAASKSVYGTPTTKWMPEMPTVPSVDWEKVQSIAQQNLQDSVNWASDQYESARVAIGAAEPTPSTYLEAAEKRAEKLADQAKHNYYAGVGIAHARYSEFLSAASTAMVSLTATPTPTDIQGSASSVASVATESAASAVSAASGAAESIASSVADVAADAKDAVGQNWDALVSRVSTQVYGAPTPTAWYENLYAAAGDYASQAGDYASVATDAAAGQIFAASSVAGDYASSAADQMAIASALAEDYAASASSAASSQYAAVSSLVSELVVGKEPTYTESVFARLGEAYTTGFASASSIASVASATIMSAAAEVTDAAGEYYAEATDKVKETVESLKDEL